MDNDRINNPVTPDAASDIPEEELNEQRRQRREKLKNLREAGRDPFLIEKWDVTASSGDIKDNFSEYDGKDVSVAGRIMTKRVMGKAAFFDIRTSRAAYSATLSATTSEPRNISGSRHTTSATSSAS